MDLMIITVTLNLLNIVWIAKFSVSDLILIPGRFPV